MAIESNGYLVYVLIMTPNIFIGVIAFFYRCIKLGRTP